MSAETWGMIARYEDPHGIYHAAEEIRDAGYKDWDACVPFPVHGLDEAMGIKPSKLPWFVLAAGITGGVSAMGFMVWSSAYDYALNIGGKPTASIPAYIPITFEFTVLLSCLTVFTMLWVLCRLPQLFYVPFKSKAFARCTDDKFFIVIEAKDARYDSEKTRALLEKTGATLIEELED